MMMHQDIFKNDLEIQKISKNFSCHVKKTKNRVFKNHKENLGFSLYSNPFSNKVFVKACCSFTLAYPHVNV